jgi:RNA polymerase sigma-70 factor (family 1)
LNSGDKYIVEQVRKRNKEAYEFLFAEHYAELVSFAENMLFDIHQSEDIVEELFIYLWENAEKVNIQVSLKSYLYQSVKNRCLNHLKRVDIKAAYDISKIESIIHDVDSEDNDVEMLEVEIEKAIASLPLKMSEVMRMKYISGEKRAVIAKSLKISELTVKTHLARGRAKLKNKLKHLL